MHADEINTKNNSGYEMMRILKIQEVIERPIRARDKNLS